MNPSGRHKIKALLPNAIISPVMVMTKTNALVKKLREELKKGTDFDWSHPTSKWGI